MPHYKLEIRATELETGNVVVQTRFVNAKNEARAFRHVTLAHITCDKVNTDEALELQASGIVCEVAADEG